ncbi:MAG: hypothetical protein HKN34_05410 [Gammaproteobacteria bacterium]|nr:hypothetical protein [Gammaproteobacteria bacterium]
MKSSREIREKIEQKLDSNPGGSALKQVICLDDLERWHGDLDYCLSYVNQLVEHRNCKCILIGNLQELSSANMAEFSRAQEKTIRHVYQFSPSLEEILDIAMDLVEYRSLASRQFIRSLIKANAKTLDQLLTSISMGNIRVLAEAIQLYDIIYRHHSSALKSSRGLAFTYFMTLISVIVLVKRSSLESAGTKKLLEGDHESNKGFKFLSEIGYFDKELTMGLDEESRILLDTIFYRLDKISLHGICSIVRNGFYRKDDFKDEFSKWIDEQYYEIYLDREQYYELENEPALEVFNQAIESFITRCEVTNPVTLLLLAERVVEDIDNGAVDYDPVRFKKQVVETVDKLYESGKMETVEVKLFDLAGERFRNCIGIYSYIIRRNNDHLTAIANDEIAGFWKKLVESPEFSDSLMARFSPISVLSLPENPEEVMESLELLNNAQLNRLLNWITDGLDNSRFPENSKSGKNLVALSRLLVKAHGNSVGIRASHFRRLAQILNTNKIVDQAV